MTNEQIEIEKAYQRVIAELTTLRNTYFEECHQEEYKDLTAEDVYIWFIEGLN